jgi:hypothetical protein
MAGLLYDSGLRLIECLRLRVKEKRIKPQRHKEHKGLEVISILVASSEEEIKKMD